LDFSVKNCIVEAVSKVLALKKSMILSQIVSGHEVDTSHADEPTLYRLVKKCGYNMRQKGDFSRVMTLETGSYFVKQAVIDPAFKLRSEFHVEKAA